MATSCALPTAMSFAHGGQPGQDRSPLRPLLMPRRLPKRTLRVPRHLNADDALVGALDRRGRNDDGKHGSPRSATRSLAIRQPLRWGSARFPDRGSPSVCAAPQRRTPPPPTPMWRRTGVVLAVTNPSASADDESNRGSISELPPATSNSYVASTLRKDFQVLFANYIPNTPVGCTNVNSLELIKLKGNLAFPREPSHPRGLLRGASPQKNGPIFLQKFASTLSTIRPKPRANSGGARVGRG
jgi:hypothetical protein